MHGGLSLPPDSPLRRRGLGGNSEPSKEHNMKKLKHRNISSFNRAMVVEPRAHISSYAFKKR
eukprot:5492708-Amphidinium_carterae.1